MQVKEEEEAALRASLGREKEREILKLEGVHAKQLKAKEEELALLKASLTKERDERLTKLTATVKELNVCPRVDIAKAVLLGLPNDVDIHEIIRDYIKTHIKGKRAAPPAGGNGAAKKKARSK